MPSKKQPKKQVEQIDDIEAAFNSLKGIIPDLTDLADCGPVSADDVLPTPSLTLNMKMGKDRGIRKGSIVQWYGPGSALKTWVALEMCREAQKKWPNKPVAYIDAEYRVDIVSAATDIGVNFEHIDGTAIPACVYKKPKNQEEAWYMVLQMLRSGAFSFIVIDSIKALIPKSQMEVDDEDSLEGIMAKAARINSAALPMAGSACEATGTILWLINQERTTTIDKRTGYTKVSYPGGKALEYYPTHIIEVMTRPKPKDEVNDACFLTLRTDKLKYGRPEQKFEVPIVLGHGIDREGDLISLGCDSGVIERNGSYYYYEGTRIGQGLSNAGDFLRNNPTMADEITDKIIACYE